MAARRGPGRRNAQGVLEAAVNELQVILRAREFIRKSGIDSVPVDLTQYAAAVNAIIKIKHDMGDAESGQTFPIGEKHIIVVNGNQRDERQRFTALHEIAHIELGLPSQHDGQSLSTERLLSYRRRPPEEVACDVFAAECLLPYEFFKTDAGNEDVGFDAIRRLAGRYRASLPATGSRFAVHASAPCAFVLIESGKIRHVTYSKHLRELNGWIKPGAEVPDGSVARRIIQASANDQDYDEIPTDIWFEGSKIRHDVVCEEAVNLSEWDQCLSMIWIDESLRPSRDAEDRDSDGDEPLLRELDGNLPWPSKSRRR